MFTTSVIGLFIVILVFLAVKIVHTLQAKDGILKTSVLVVVFAVLFTGSSILWKRDINYSSEIIKPLESGWPIPFYLRDHPMKEAWQAPVTVWNNFFSSLFLNAIMWGVIFTLGTALFQKIGFRARPLSMKHFFAFFIVVVGALVVIYVSKAISWKARGFDNPIIILPSSVSLPTSTPHFNKQ